MIIAQIQAAELAQELRQTLLPITFVWCVIGLWDVLWKHGGEVKAILGAIFRVLVVAVLVWQYPNFVQEGREALSGLRENVFSQSGETHFQKVLMAEVQAQPGAMDFAGQICSALVHSLQGFGRMMLSILMFLQAFCLEGLIAISPILLGFLAWDLTRPMAIQFCFTTIGILLWEVGVLIVDVLLLGLGENYLGPALGAGATISAAGVITGVLSWPLLLSAVVIAALTPAFLYLSIPFIIATVLRGGDPTGPLLLKAMQMAATTTGGAMMPQLKGMAATGSSILNSLRGASTLSGLSGEGSAGPSGSSESASAGSADGSGHGGEASGGGSISPLATAPAEKSGGLPLSLEMSSPTSSSKEGKSTESASNVGEIYVGNKGHTFQQLTPMGFSCKNPHTGFTTQHQGNIALRGVADASVFDHNTQRMSSGDMHGRTGKRKEKSQTT